MAVEIRKTKLQQAHKHYGTYEVDGLFDAVLFSSTPNSKAKQIGWRPANSDDPNHQVLHPLSGVPQQLCEAAVKQSGGKLTSTLAAPTPHTQVVETDDE